MAPKGSTKSVVPAVLTWLHDKLKGPRKRAELVYVGLLELGHDSETIKTLDWSHSWNGDSAVSVLQKLGVKAHFNSKANHLLGKQYNPRDVKPRKVQRQVHEFYGLDAETYKGAARLVCVEGTGKAAGLEVWLYSYKDLPELLWALTNTRVLRSACVTSYNLRFDAESILKHLLGWVSDTEMEHLCTFSTIDVHFDAGEYSAHYRIHYVPTKILRVTRLSGERGEETQACFSLYDMAQFFPGMRLQQASQAYLKEQKIDTVDASRLNTDLEYWSGREQEVAKYCRQDARLCARLAAFMASKVWDLWAVDFKSPYSPAQISQKLFLSRSGTLTPIRSHVAAQDCYNSYYGGRIECRTRGELGWACVVDLKSAYIWAMLDLPDTAGTWVRHKGESQALDLSPYAFVKASCKVTAAEDSWGPLPVRRVDGLLTYPSGVVTGWWPWPEVKWAIDNDIVKDVVIHRSTWLDPKDAKPVYPFQYLDEVFKQKESEQDPARKHVIKVCGLGMYGKTAQTTDKLVEDYDGDPETFIGLTPVSRSLQPGYLFNPAIAAYVTSRTRMRLMGLAYSLGNNATAVFTDSVIVTKPLDMHDGKLGGWERKDEQGKCRMLMAGMYQFEGQKPKVRGLPMGGAASGQDVDYWKLKGKEAVFSRDGPMHLNGAVRRGQAHLVNTWQPRVKKLTPNSDQKRHWPVWKTFDDMFSGAHVGRLLTSNKRADTVLKLTARNEQPRTRGVTRR